MTFYIICFISFMLTLLLTPVAIRIAPHIGGIDIPKDNRRVHTKPIPRVGGIAIYIGVTAAILICLPHSMKIMGIVVGGTIIFILGLVDDVKELPALVKLLGQIAAASIVFAMGIRIEFLHLFAMDRIGLGMVFAYICTVIWFVAITNTINLIDGMDGLAAGVVAIGSCCIAYVAYIHGTYHQVLPMMAIAAACMGFLPWNFYPAKTFMGDCGSQFLGFMIGAFSIIGLVKSATLFALVIPLTVLGLPLFDTGYAIIRRLIRRKPIMEADKEHIHHSFMKSGMGQRRSVLCMYGICAIMGTAAVLLSRGLQIEGIGLMVIAFGYIYVIITDRDHVMPAIMEELIEDITVHRENGHNEHSGGKR